MNEQDRIIDEAVGWRLACDLPEMDWDAFSLWLEADPRHRAAFDEIALADAALGEHREALKPAFAANDDTPRQKRWGRLAWPGSAIAASLVAVLAFQQFGPGAQTYQTGSQARTIALEDGSRIELAPSSRLGVDGEQIALSGGAWFDIRHDPSRQLSISANGVQITDIGTKFDVQAAAGQVRVEVAEGRVRVSSEAMSRPVDLAQGRALAFDPKGGTATVTQLAVSDVGEWRTGRLSFEAAPLTLVAADLARYAGVKVEVSDKVEDRHFTGTLVIRDREAALRDLSQLMDLELVRSSDSYRLEPRTR